ncbi:HDOD domain-containing protein [Sinobacterium caligoides]|uniref:HDOD domain-containing protein n=1 Tax=Sinobacterium caligoides TaxID=933926 RepID=A0A3N2DJN5_9GAMM|nr:HDOD domain-containing protein [Sinobacterium caligoides]ROR99987.1 HDOD domain-containing protein [Sinobacterium caligoides]
MTRGVSAWTKRLTEHELPVLGAVIGDIHELATGVDCDASQLAEVILKDAALTQQVLRVANSSHYNPSPNNRINTISRAVVTLGTSGIKAVCISLMMIDSLLKGQPRQRTLTCLARAFHAAVQARRLYALRTGGSNEEVFIAALLLHIGEIGFWTFGGNQADMLDKQLDIPGSDSGALIELAIGTSFVELSRNMCEHWSLSEVVAQSMAPLERSSPMVTAVLLGDRISHAVEQGWQTKAVAQLSEKASLYCGVKIKEMRQHLLLAADEAASVALTFGANKICHLIPSSVNVLSESPQHRLKPDSNLQLDILRELGTVIGGNTDINTILQMVLEGMHRGVGLERVAVCMLSHKSKQAVLYAKFVLGNVTPSWRKSLIFAADAEAQNPLAHCLVQREVMHMKSVIGPRWNYLASKRFIKVKGCGGCVLAPLFVGERNVGVFYADRGDLGVEVDAVQVERFTHFAQQANIALALLSKKQRH